MVESDFTILTGGNNQTIAGEFITYLYLLVIIAIFLTLMQEQFVLNKWIDSTQMASLNSDLIVSNTLLVSSRLYLTQIPLDNKSITSDICNDGSLKFTI